MDKAGFRAGQLDRSARGGTGIDLGADGRCAVGRRAEEWSTELLLTTAERAPRSSLVRARRSLLNENPCTGVVGTTDCTSCREKGLLVA